MAGTSCPSKSSTSVVSAQSRSLTPAPSCTSYAVGDESRLSALADRLPEEEDRIVLDACTTTSPSTPPCSCTETRRSPARGRRSMGIGYDTQNLRVYMNDAGGERRVLLDGVEEMGEYEIGALERVA